MASGNPSNAAYPAALDPLTPKVTADNGGDFADLLQPKNQMARVADPTDLATALTAIIAIRNGLIAIGVMKAS